MDLGHRKHGAARQDMGIGIGAVEDILSRMEDYGYITSDQWHSSLEDLSKYKSSLSALEELYNSMDSGEHNLPYHGIYHKFQHRVFHLLNKPLRVLRFSLGEAIATINPSSVFLLRGTTFIRRNQMPDYKVKITLNLIQENFKN